MGQEANNEEIISISPETIFNSFERQVCNISLLNPAIDPSSSDLVTALIRIEMRNEKLGKVTKCSEHTSKPNRIIQTPSGVSQVILDRSLQQSI
jgi:hypothetical protein